MGIADGTDPSCERYLLNLCVPQTCNITAFVSKHAPYALCDLRT